jgi:hypothetical protein
MQFENHHERRTGILPGTVVNAREQLAKAFNSMRVSCGSGSNEINKIDREPHCEKQDEPRIRLFRGIAGDSGEDEDSQCDSLCVSKRNRSDQRRRFHSSRSPSTGPILGYPRIWEREKFENHAITFCFKLSQIPYHGTIVRQVQKKGGRYRSRYLHNKQI